MSLNSLLYLSNDGIMAAQGGLNVTGQNVTNASTPGYVQENPIFDTVQGTASGVVFEGASRQANQYTLNGVVTQSGLLGQSTSESTALTAVQSVFSQNGSTPLADDMNALFKAFQDLSGDAGDSSARQQVLAQGQTLASDFNSASAGLATQSSNIVQQIGGLLGTTNQQLQQLGTLNVAIEKSLALGQDASSLQNQREQILTQLGTSIGAKGIVNAKGGMTVFAGGMALVDDSSVTSLSAGQDPTTGNVQVFATSPKGAKQEITNGFQSGNLAGLIQVHNTEIPSVNSQLDQVAFDFANAVNSVNQSGVGLDGSTGNKLFDVPATATGAAHSICLDPAVANNPNAIAASTTAGGLPAGNDNAVALAQISEQSIGAGGTPTSRIADIVGNVGTLTETANNSQTLYTNTLSQAQTMQDSATGVNMQQELTNLTKFQNAYEASVRVLQTANTLMSDLMTAIT